MKKYNEIFRKNAVELLHDLSLDSCFTHDNIQIKNVRQLCVFLGISSDTLYRWQKEFSSLKSEKKDVSDESIPKRVKCYAEDWCKAYQSDYDEGYGNCNMLGDCNDFKNLDDFNKEVDEMNDLDNEENKMLEKVILDDIHESGSDTLDFDDIYYEKETRIATKSKIAEKLGHDNFFVPVQDKNIVKEKDIFGIRYYAWQAKTLEIKNYSRMVLAQLKLAIGNELIKQSGLVDMKQASKKLKKNGDKL